MTSNAAQQHRGSGAHRRRLQRGHGDGGNGTETKRHDSPGDGNRGEVRTGKLQPQRAARSSGTRVEDKAGRTHTINGAADWQTAHPFSTARRSDELAARPRLARPGCRPARPNRGPRSSGDLMPGSDRETGEHIGDGALIETAGVGEKHVIRGRASDRLAQPPAETSRRRRERSHQGGSACRRPLGPRARRTAGHRQHRGEHQGGASNTSIGLTTAVPSAVADVNDRRFGLSRRRIAAPGARARQRLRVDQRPRATPNHGPLIDQPRHGRRIHRPTASRLIQRETDPADTGRDRGATSRVGKSSTRRNAAGGRAPSPTRLWAVSARSSSSVRDGHHAQQPGRSESASAAPVENPGEDAGRDGHQATATLQPSGRVRR